MTTRSLAARLSRLEKLGPEGMGGRTPEEHGRLFIAVTALLCLTPDEHQDLRSIPDADDDVGVDEWWTLLELGTERLRKHFDDMEPPPTIPAQIAWAKGWEDRSFEWLPPERFMDMPQPGFWTPLQRDTATKGYRAAITAEQERRATLAGAL